MLFVYRHYMWTAAEEGQEGYADRKSYLASIVRRLLLCSHNDPQLRLTCLKSEP